MDGSRRVGAFSQQAMHTCKLTGGLLSVGGLKEAPCLLLTPAAWSPHAFQLCKSHIQNNGHYLFELSLSPTPVPTQFSM